MQAGFRKEEGSWNYDSTAETNDNDTDHGEDPEQATPEAEQDDEDSGGYYYSYGCLMVTTGPKLSAAAAFTEQKQVVTPTARRVTREALNVGKPTSMLGDGAFDMQAWHDHLIEEGVVPIAPYNQQNADDPYDIEYRIDQRITEHSDTVRLWPKEFKETYKKRSQVVRTICACKDCGLKPPGVRGHVRVKAHILLTPLSSACDCYREL